MSHASRLSFYYRQLRLELRTCDFQVALGSWFTKSSGFYVESCRSQLNTDFTKRCRHDSLHLAVHRIYYCSLEFALYSLYVTYFTFQSFWQAVTLSWPTLNLFNCSTIACKAGSIFDPASDTSCNVHLVMERLFTVYHDLDHNLLFTTIPVNTTAQSSWTRPVVVSSSHCVTTHVLWTTLLRADLTGHVDSARIYSIMPPSILELSHRTSVSLGLFSFQDHKKIRGGGVVLEQRRTQQLTGEKRTHPLHSVRAIVYSVSILADLLPFDIAARQK
jgi:hypothetical protein